MNNIKKVIWDSGLRKNYIAEQMGIQPSNISIYLVTKENRDEHK